MARTSIPSKDPNRVDSTARHGRPALVFPLAVTSCTLMEN